MHIILLCILVAAISLGFRAVTDASVMFTDIVQGSFSASEVSLKDIGQRIGSQME